MKKEIVFTVLDGLHAKPATTLVSLANQYKSTITMTYERTSVDMKSIMGVLSLGLKPGSLLTIETTGSDEVEALHDIISKIKELNVSSL
jgi:phosphocarrier protein HPr